MTQKHRNYPVLPVLLLQTPDGQKHQLMAVLCAQKAAEMVLTLSMGVDGDLIEHSYSLGLAPLLGRYKIPDEAIEKIQREYSERARGRIKLDAVLLGTDLWLKKALFQFPQCEPLVVLEQEEVWMKMASGQIRPDLVHITLTGAEVVNSTETDD